MNRPLAVTIASVLMGTGAALAHPPGPDGQHDDLRHVDPAKVRTWTNTRTGEAVRGAFLATRTEGGGVRVSIERENGDVVVFALDDLAEPDRAEARRRMDEAKAANQPRAPLAVAQPAPGAPGKAGPQQAAPFDAFAPFVTTRSDDRWLYIECDGLPHVPGGKAGTYTYSHPMMVGITAWQQQVPLPQSYRGSNAWQIPLKPEMADKPVSAKEQLFRGAIALAANGVPIFNPIKNDGRTDTFLAGELDEFGGHCGRADDYHYHIAPTHLQKYVGKGAPVAYALDGFPIYGLFDPAAKSGDEKACPLGGTEKLDELNGHSGAPTKGPGPDGSSTVSLPGLYHYHASSKYPYLNGGMRGKVTVKDDQIDPQPRATPVRDWLQPLRGAKIIGFKATGKESEKAWSLEYSINGKPGFVNYRIEGDRPGTPETKFVFEFISPDGTRKTETYSAQGQARGGRREGGNGGGGGDRRRPREDGDRPRRDDPRPQDPPKNAAGPAVRGGFSVTSPDVTDGRLSVECTCDGMSRSPTLAWSSSPTDTKAFAAIMHHIPPDGGTHVYMVVANIPATARELKSGDTKLGAWGQNTVNRRSEYAPPCSKGPGDKLYTITIYALSAEAKLPQNQPLSRDALLAAIKDSTLAAATMDVKYARTGR